MSTTKDKSQGPYTVNNDNGMYRIDGPGISTPLAIDYRSAEMAEIEAYRLNAAYEAGRADRDELVNALKEAKWRLRDIAELSVAHPVVSNTNQLWCAKDRAKTGFDIVEAALSRINNP